MPLPHTPNPTTTPTGDFSQNAMHSRFIHRLIARRHGGLWLVMTIALGITFATRLLFTLKEAPRLAWDASLAAAFLIGGLYDIAASLWWILLLALLLAVLPRRWFEWRVGRGLAHGLLVVVIYLLLYTAVAEWLFWDEFGVRFNFIAVDYLVYTTEVIGNIRESYPLGLILGIVLAAAVLVHGALIWSGLLGTWFANATVSASKRWREATIWCVVTLGLGIGLNERFIPPFANNYNRELAKNGIWSLFAAFRANQLEFDQFYSTLPDKEAFQRVGRRLHREGAGNLSRDSRDMLRMIEVQGPELRLNVIQITVESLSASFLTRYGNDDRLTPTLDQVAKKSLVFDRFYATGTRTDRGMEALTLSVPPTPGRSLVKRPDNAGLFTIGSVFRSKGYNTAFIYGGFGYFDNMNAFFGGNGYRVVDRTLVGKDDITFANVWGACDEDLFRWTLREADRDFAAGKPFFHFVMTTSNHRPYTFPEGRIDLPSKISGRKGAVKYSDYAIGEFLRQAESKPWFKNTVFVIVGDHCASSAGKTTLPMENYRVPLVIYTPGGQLGSGTVTKATSQIDYAPTLLGLLRWSYPSRFFGRDVLSPQAGADGPLFIGTYQKLGMYRRGGLAVLQPVRQAEAYDYDRDTHGLTRCDSGDDLIKDATASYQTAAWVFKNKAQREYAAPTTQP